MTTKHLGATDGMAFSQTRGSGRTTQMLLQVVRQLRDGNSVILNASNMDYNRELVQRVRKGMDGLGFVTYDHTVSGAYYGFYVIHPITKHRAYLFRGNQLTNDSAYEPYKRKYNALVFTDHYKG